MTMPVEPAQTPAAPAAPAPAPAPTAPAPAPEIPAAPPAPAPAAPAQGKAPLWDGDFDPERAARLVENLRGEVGTTKDALAAANAELEKFRQAQMSEQEKIAQRAESAEKALAEAHRKLAMQAHNLPESAAKFLTASTPDEIAAQAKELAETFAPHTSAAPAAEPLPSTLPVPGTGADVTGNDMVTREEFDRMSPAERMAAYRAGRTKHFGGR